MASTAAAGLVQPTGSWDGEPATSAAALLECTIYKATRLQSDLVVRRKLRVQHDKLQTFHDYEKNPKDHKTWYLDRGCKLEPESADEITQQRKLVRPPGTWTVTASVLPGSGQPVDLYCFSLAWPSTWLATKGYGTFHMGFTTKEEAVRAHSCLEHLLTMLQMRASSSRSDGQHMSHSHKSSYDDLGALMNGAGSREGAAVRKAASARQHRPGELTVQQWSQDKDSSVQAASGDGQGSPFARAAANRRTFEEDWQDAEQGDGSSTVESCEEEGGEGFASSLDDSDEASSSDAEHSDAAPPAERWVPYRHTNGVAIYFQRTHDDHGVMGSGSMCPGSSGSSEYMASSIVRGSPDECLAVLLDPSSHTTILGPASRIDVLENGQERQVLRLTVEATGMTRRICAPRQVVVERVFKREDAGINVVLFSSTDDTPTQQQQQRRGRGGWLSWPSWYRPVRATVRGGYTISPREDAEGAAPECLVTCILKVDLGGVCGECSWLRPFADAVGWVDAYVERMLMAVILVKDEVEQRRFLVQPYSMFGADEPQAVKKRQRRRRRQRAGEDGGGQGGADALEEGGADQSGSGVGRAASRADGSGGSGGGARRDQTSGEAVAVNGGGGSAGGREQRQHRGKMSARALRPSSSRKRSTNSANGVASAASPAPRGTQATVHEAGPLGCLPGSLSLLEQRFWSELHGPGGPAPFKVRGASYLSDKRKVPAGVPEFVLSSVDLVITDKPTQHISRFLPSVRKNGAPFTFVVNLIIPGTPVLSLVGVFVSENHPSCLGPSPPTAEEAYASGWQPFDYALHRFLNAGDTERSLMFKLIPHIADGSWVIKQSVGTVPLIVGTKLHTSYHSAPSYFEVSIDVSSSSAAAYITGMVRGTTKSLVIDIGFLLEGQSEGELPESLIGAFRLHHLDLSYAKPVDTSKELPLPPGPPAASVAVSCAGGGAEDVREGRVSTQGPRSMTTHSRNRSGASMDELMLLASTGPPSLQLTPTPSSTQRHSSQDSAASSSRTPLSHTPAGALTPSGAQTPGTPSPPLTTNNSGVLAAAASVPAASGAVSVAGAGIVTSSGAFREPSSSMASQRGPSSSITSQRGASSGARANSHRRSSSGEEGTRHTPSTATSAPKHHGHSPSGSSMDLTKLSAAACIARAQATTSAAPAGVGAASQAGTAGQGRTSGVGAAATAAGAAGGAAATGDAQQQLPQLRQRLSLESSLLLPTPANTLPSPLAHSPNVLASSPILMASSPNGGTWGGAATPPRHHRRHSRHRSMGSASDHPKLTALEQIRLAEASLRAGHSTGGAFAASEQQQ